jgi:peptidoglycan-N-acetylglucosamine deacetylase
MTAAMKKDVKGRLAGFLGEDIGGPPSCGGADGSEGLELNVSFSFLVSSGDVLGVRLTTLDRTSNADGIDTRAYWYDGAAKKYRPSPGLIADDSQDAFVSALKKRLEKREGVTPDTVEASLGDRENRNAYLDDMAFTADGDLKVDFDRGTVGLPRPAASLSPSPRRPSPRGCPTSAAAPRRRPPTRTTSSTSVAPTPPPRPSPPSRTRARTPRTAPRPSASP